MQTRISGSRRWTVVGLAALAVLATLAGAAAPAGATIIGTLDEPDGVASGVGNVAGWAYTTMPGAAILSPIDVYIDGVKQYEVPCCSGRGDVKAAHPEAPLETGFSGPFNWGLLVPGSHEIEVMVKSSGGESRTLSATITTVRIEDLTFLSRLRFTQDSECTFGNESADGNASIRCTKVLAERLVDGSARLCNGSIVISWDRAKQLFKLTTGCTPGCTEDSDCNDGVFCNGVESCDESTGLCVALSSCPPFLDGCVIRGGICDEDTDSCIDQPDDSACNDGQFCNGVESCNVETGGCAAVSPCPPAPPNGCVTPGLICDEVTDSCEDLLDDALCPTGETCQPDGSCAP